MTTEPEPPSATPPADPLSLSTRAARNLTTTTKSVPQMQGISSRWLLRALPWVDVRGGTYRVNRRRQVRIGRGRVAFDQSGADDVRVVPETLTELPPLRGYSDPEVLRRIAERFTVRHVRSGEVLTEQGDPIDRVFLVAHGRLVREKRGRYGSREVLGVLTDGGQLGDEALGQQDPAWSQTVTAATDGTVLELDWVAFRRLLDQVGSLREHLDGYLAAAGEAANRKGEAEVAVAAGHHGEPLISGTYVDYELAPREYELSVAQTVLRLHTRVADLFNDPMDQTREQLRLTVHELRERQEWELVNNREFGLLHNADYEQRISTAAGPPTPDDLDELISMRRGTDRIFAHPKAIAAFLRECNKRGLNGESTTLDGHKCLAWRGIPLLPLGKLEVSGEHTTSILAMRSGEDDGGVVGLHQTGIPEELEPSLNVRFMGITEQAIVKYLVSVYYSAAVLVPDALGVLENVQIGVGRA